MEDLGSASVAQPFIQETRDSQDSEAGSKARTVSTHVLVPEEQADRLRQLSRTTRVAQSEYLREAVEDLLAKYDRLNDDDSNDPTDPEGSASA